MLTKNAHFVTAKAAILAEPTIAAAATVITTTNQETGEVTKRVADPQAVSDFFNADHATLRVWRRGVSARSVREVVNFSELTSRSIQEQNSFAEMLRIDFLDFNAIGIRDGVQNQFNGTTGSQTRQAIYALGKRKATKAEALFADFTAPNVGTIADPGLLGLEGPMTATDVETALTR